MPEIILTENTILWLQVIIGIVVGMAIRDLANNFVQGVMFKHNTHFEQGDHVIVDNSSGVIISIGYRHTVFRLQKEDGTVCWRYVPNSRIPFLKLEKVIEDPTLPELEKRVAALEGKRREND